MNNLLNLFFVDIGKQWYTDVVSYVYVGNSLSEVRYIEGVGPPPSSVVRPLAYWKVNINLGYIRELCKS